VAQKSQKSRGTSYAINCKDVPQILFRLKPLHDLHGRVVAQSKEGVLGSTTDGGDRHEGTKNCIKSASGAAAHHLQSIAKMCTDIIEPKIIML